MSVVAGVVHAPGPFPDDAPYTRYCTGCQPPAVWPCPDRLAEMGPVPPPQRRALEQAELAIVNRVAMWWHVEGIAGLEYRARTGGTVVGYADTDDERVFRVLVWDRRIPYLVDVERSVLDPAGCHEPDRSVLRGHAENLARFALDMPATEGNDRARLCWLQLASACMERAAS